MKLGLSNKVIQSLGGWETPDMVSHYAASLTFDDALAIIKLQTSNRLEIVYRYTRSVSFHDSMKFYKAPLS